MSLIPAILALSFASCLRVDAFLTAPASSSFAAGSSRSMSLRGVVVAGNTAGASVRRGGRGGIAALRAQIDVRETKILIERLEKNLDDLTALRSSLSAEVEELRATLSEKKASLTLIEDRLQKVASEFEMAKQELRIASMEMTPAVIVGDGRLGAMLRANGDQDDVMVRSTSEMKFQLKQNPGGSGKEGPIYLCVPNSALAELVDACPEERRQDLVFMGSGNLDDFLAEKGLTDCTQALIYAYIGKLGDTPIDGVTELDPDGLTCAVGKWAPDLAKRLRQVKMSCRILTAAEFEVSRLERLIWTCSVHLVAKANDLKTIGQVTKDAHWQQTSSCMEELAAAVHSASGVAIKESFYRRMKMYTESVGSLTTVVKDLPFRNGYFYQLSQKALGNKLPDPCPLHTKLLKKIKAVK